MVAGLETAVAPRVSPSGRFTADKNFPCTS